MSPPLRTASSLPGGPLVWMMGASLWFALTLVLGGVALHPLLYGLPIVAATLLAGVGPGALMALWAYVLLVGLGPGSEDRMLLGLCAVLLGAALARRWR